ncbi:hypothetical protein KEM56_004867, partial [Ascosphaera pollenicola]
PVPPVTAGRNLDAIYSGLKDQEERFEKVLKGAVSRNGNDSSEKPVPANSSRSQEQLTNAPTPASQETPSEETQSNGLLHKVATDISTVNQNIATANKNAADAAHNAVHDAVGHLPGGKNAQNIAHGFADRVNEGGHNFFPGSPRQA